MADREYRVVYKAVADFADLIRQSKLAESKLRAMQDAQAVDRKSLRDLDSYADAVGEVGKQATDTASSLGDMADSAKSADKSTRQSTKASREQAAALRDVAQAQRNATSQEVRSSVARARSNAQMRKGLQGLKEFVELNKDATESQRERSLADRLQAVRLAQGSVVARRSMAGLREFLDLNKEVTKSQTTQTTEIDRNSSAWSRFVGVLSRHRRETDSGTTSVHKMTTAMREFSARNGDARSALQKLGEGFRNFGSIAKGIGMPTLVMVFGKTAVNAVYALAGAATVLVQSLAQLGPLIASAPGGIIAIAQAALGAKVAIKGVAAALKLYAAEQKDSQPKTFAEALQQMGPATRKFTKELVGMQGAWKKIQNATQEAFFGQFVGDLGRVKSLLPVVRNLLVTGAKAAGDFASKAAKMLSGSDWKQSFRLLSKSSTVIVDRLGDSLLSVADGFRKIAVAARPLTEWLAGRFAELGAEFNTWADGINSVSFAKASLRFDQFVIIIKNLGSVIHSVFVAAAGTTDWFMQRFTLMSDKWATATRDAAQRGGALKKFFDDLRPVMSETAGLFADLFKGLGKAVDMSSLTRIVQMIRQDVVPAILSIMDSWGDSGAVEAWVKSLTKMVSLFAKLSDAGFFSAMTSIVNVFGDLLAIIDRLISNPVGQFFLNIAGAVAKVVTPFLLLNKALKLHLVLSALVARSQAALGLETVATRAGMATRAVSGLSGALSKMMSPLGLLVTAVAAVGWYGFTKMLDKTKQMARESALSVDQLTESLRNTGTAFSEQSATVKQPWWVGGNLDKTTASLKELATYFGDTSLRDNISNFFNTSQYGGGINGAEMYEEQLKNVTEAIKQLAQTNPDEAARQIQILEGTLRNAGKSEDYIQGIVGPLKEVLATAIDAGAAVSDFVSELESTTPVQNMTQALSGYEAAIDAVTQSLANNGKTAKNHGRELDLSTQAGRDNQAALDGIAQAAKEVTAQQIRQGDSTEEIAKKTRQARQDFIHAARQMGLNKDAAKDLADQYGLIPGQVTTELKQRGYDQMKSNLAHLKDQILNLDGMKIDVEANLVGPGGMQQPLFWRDKKGDLHKIGTPAQAEGGQVRGPGSTTSDSIPAWLSDQEYVIQAAAVNKYGVPFFDALNAMRFSDGGMVGFKLGGKVGGSVKNASTNSKKVPNAVAQKVADKRSEFRSAKYAKADNSMQLAQARKQLRDAQQALAEATDEEAQKIRTDEAAQKVREAEEELADATKDLQEGISVKAAELERDKSQLAYQEALDDFTQGISVGAAKVDLAKAEEDYQDALEDQAKGISVGRAQVDLAGAEEDYRQALLDASTGLSVRGAQADVASAEEAYRKVMASATASEAEKMQARQALEEARVGVENAAQATQLRLQETAQKRLEAEDNLGDTQAQVDLRVLETSQSRLEAQQNLKNTEAEVALKVRETRQAYDDAVRNVEIVRREVADRAADAGLSLTQAQREAAALPGQFQEEIASAKLGVREARFSLRETKRQNKADTQAFNAQLKKYGKRETDLSTAPLATQVKYASRYQKSLGKNQKSSIKGYRKWLAKHGPYVSDSEGTIGVFDVGAARSDSWKEYKKEQASQDKQTFDMADPGAQTDVMDQLADKFGNRVENGETAPNAGHCLENVRVALQNLGFNVAGSPAMAGSAAAARDMLKLNHGNPPRGAIVFSGANHVGVSDGRGNVLNTYSGNRYERIPMNSMSGGYAGWVYPSALAGRQVGGQVKSGKPYMVGEAGQELFVPDVNGRILTAAQTAKLLAAANGSASFGVNMGLPGLAGVPTAAIPGASAASIAAAGSVARFGDIHVHNPVPERASDSIQKRVKILTNRES